MSWCSRAPWWAWAVAVAILIIVGGELGAWVQRRNDRLKTGVLKEGRDWRTWE